MARPNQAPFYVRVKLGDGYRLPSSTAIRAVNQSILFDASSVTEKVYRGAVGWPARYKGVRSDAAFYFGARVLR